MKQASWCVAVQAPSLQLSLIQFQIQKQSSNYIVDFTGVSFLSITTNKPKDSDSRVDGGQQDE